MNNCIKNYLKYHFLAAVIYGLKIRNLLFWLISKEDISCPVPDKIKSIKLTEFRNTFFGYFDKSPFKPGDNNIIAFQANNCKPWHVPDARIPTSILLYDIGKNKILKEIAQTYSWNWQQGARLFWLNEQELIYNKYDPSHNCYFSEIYNVVSNKFKTFPVPVQDSFKDNYIITISYKALSCTRPDYGYRNHNNNGIDLLGEKIKIFYISEKKLKTLCSVSDLILLTEYAPYLAEIKKPRVNHISISPQGDKFIFLLRFYYKFELKHYLFLFNLQTNETVLLSKDNMISHYCWLDKNNILLWGVISKKGDYYILNLENKSWKCLNTGLSDGHPSMLDDENFITDTYPDKSRLRKLLLVNLSTSKQKTIGEFFEPAKFISETRCDLHPHPDPEKQNVHIDRIVKGYRTLSIISLKDLK